VRRRARIGLLLAAGLFAVGGCGPTAPDAPARDAASTLPPANAAQIERGHQLAVLGHCAGCHTARGGSAMAGGRPLPTPFGVVYPGNLTPDADTGLGGWTADDFFRALHHGRSRDGRALVPAFPYTSYTHVTRDDSDALFAYLRSLPPVVQANRPHALRFPYGTPFALSLWQWLFFQPADLDSEAAARRALPPRLARGGYLVQGLGHCGECHAPRNAFGAPAAEATGAEMPLGEGYAPPLNPVAGIAMPADEIVALLKAGQTARSSVLGPMAGVVFGSTQHWPDDDLRAVAEYIAALPPLPAPPAADAAPPALMQAGQRVYDDRCADCHGAQGQGAPGAYPALAGNPTVQQPSVTNLVKLLHHGGFAPATAAQPRPYGMPPQMLTEDETAAVLTYLRQGWGHQASAVTPAQVLRLR
jgi:mono/diheme cytochrome c family protein